MMPVKADLAIIALPLVCLDSAGVWLSCQAIIWICGFLQIRSQISSILFKKVPLFWQKGPYFVQKNPPGEVSGYGLV